MNTIVRPRLDELASPRRNHFFYGKLLDELHLRMEQDHFNGKRRMLNRLGLGRGVLCGLQVTPDGKSVCVLSGVAIDAYGREIVVPQKVCIDPSKITAECGTVRDRDSKQEARVYLALCYRECAADFVPALVTDCKPQDQCAPSTIVESYCLEVRANEPPAITHDNALCDAITGGKDAAEKRKRLCEVLTTSGCSTVSGDACVGLAAIDLAEDGTVTNVDCCSFRERVYSNDQLFELLLCLHAEGQGAPGSDGKQGPPGDPGPGLESSLTRIVATSWVHEHVHSGTDKPFVPVAGKILLSAGTAEYVVGFGLVIGFSGPVKAPLPDPLPSFEVMVRDSTTAPAAGLYSWYGLNGLIMPVTDITLVGDRITGAAVQLTSSNDLPAEGKGLAFILDEKLLLALSKSDLVLVRLRGDFIIDIHGKAVDAEFVRATFPTGDGPPGTGLGLQGGMFESWFAFGGEQTHQMIGPQMSAKTVSVNNATTLELAMVPGIGMAAAKAIVAARDKKRDKRFRRMEELKIGGIDEPRLALATRYLKIP